MRSGVGRDGLLLAAFLVLLSLPALDALLNLDPAPPMPERRRPAAWPAPPGSLAELERWPVDFEAAHRDRFGFRRTLLRAHRHVWLRWLGVSPSPYVVVGRDGWLFHRGELMKEACGELLPWSSEQVDATVELYRTRRRWFAAIGATYSVVPFPEKALVQRDGLNPIQLRAITATPRWRTLMETLDASGVDHIDLLEPFQAAARERGPVFLRTDQHWNAHGNMVAARLLSEFNRRVSGSEPAPIRLRYSVVPTGPGPGMGQAEELAASDVFLEDTQKLAGPLPPARVELTMDSNTAPMGGQRFRSLVPGARGHAVFLRDSFVYPLQRLLAEDFATSLFVGLQWNTIPTDLILSEAPDHVIHAWWGERFLVPPPLEDLSSEKAR